MNKFFVPRGALSFLMYLGFALSVSFLLDRLQYVVFCFGESNCQLWGSFFLFLFITGILVFILFGGWGKWKAKRKDDHIVRTVCKIVFPLALLFSVYVSYCYFFTYTKLTDSQIEYREKDFFLNESVLQANLNEASYLLSVYKASRSSHNRVSPDKCYRDNYLVLKNGSKIKLPFDGYLYSYFSLNLKLQTKDHIENDYYSQQLCIPTTK